MSGSLELCVQVKVHGLQGLTYKDNTNNMLEDKEDRKLVVFPGELDRIYVKTPDVIEVSFHYPFPMMQDAPLCLHACRHDSGLE